MSSSIGGGVFLVFGKQAAKQVESCSVFPVSKFNKWTLKAQTSEFSRNLFRKEHLKSYFRTFVNWWL